MLSVLFKKFLLKFSHFIGIFFTRFRYFHSYNVLIIVERSLKFRNFDVLEGYQPWSGYASTDLIGQVGSARLVLQFMAVR